ncbi:hypothetical protein JQ597_04515 [Bradyrhizobium sp. AUGA SZCCT0177]|uniref:hypothetical protein n=1 Tax=Bradyrhizobium sp. AUGA SZCCT0177 TaxID=2807665 RepID=UPI001BACD0F4|nr:hypothetical protein [Bradyrhizobium sp. AUGA SZCCT0177]MBR1281298.1 hypothetical protein [Bradyrhizobium sp. AUGA SZCCT0177]
MDNITKNESGHGPGEPWPAALSYWRDLRAEEFDEERMKEVATFVATISSTIPEWRRAAKGDAAAAIGLVLPCKPPERIGIKVDMPMTTLLNCAFDNAAAAFVLSHKLRTMPLDHLHRTRLATSWLVHNLWLGRRSFARRAFPPNPFDEGEAP